MAEDKPAVASELSPQLRHLTTPQLRAHCYARGIHYSEEDTQDQLRMKLGDPTAEHLSSKAKSSIMAARVAAIESQLADAGSLHPASGSGGARPRKTSTCALAQQFESRPTGQPALDGAASRARCGSSEAIASRAAGLQFNPAMLSPGAMPPSLRSKASSCNTRPASTCEPSTSSMISRSSSEVATCSASQYRSSSSGFGDGLQTLADCTPPPCDPAHTVPPPSTVLAPQSKFAGSTLNSEATLTRARPAPRGRRKPTKQISAMAATATCIYDDDEEGSTSPVNGSRNLCMDPSEVVTPQQGNSPFQSPWHKVHQDVAGAVPASVHMGAKRDIRTFPGADAGMGHLNEGITPRQSESHCPLSSSLKRSAIMDVSGSGVTQLPSWSAFRCELNNVALSLVTLEGVQIAMLPLADYEVTRLHGNPDPAGCLLLQPSNYSELSRSERSRQRAWIRVQTAFSANADIRSTEIDMWKSAIENAASEAEGEALEATHALLKASVGESTYSHAVEETRRQSLDGHLVVGQVRAAARLSRKWIVIQAGPNLECPWLGG